MAEHGDETKNAGVRPPGDVNPRREPVLDFPDRPFREMTRGDYEVLGFLSGLEVHQQLRTASKLFCRCPAGCRTTRVDAEVLRHMRPTLSELGEYDGTALMEFKTRKEIVYLLERGSVCTYEMDDTPPFEMDPEAVSIAIEIARLFSLNLVSELHVMRKQYLDGSIPTGFQRTAMVGLSGAVPFRVPELGVDRELRIRQLSLEEDSCREVSDVGHRITYRTDRLGMPLTEVVTEPELVTPLELQAAGRLVAQVTRATRKVLRGAGAARQDVNVSVAGGRRVEIKGVHHHRGLPLLVHNEAFRQLNLLRVKAELEGRAVTAGTLEIPDQGLPWEISPLAVDASPILAASAFGPLREARDRGEVVVAVRLPGFAGLLDHPTQPGRPFASELADRVRVIACPVHRPFFLHSGKGSQGAGALSSREWRELEEALGAGSEDGIVLVWASKPDAATAVREILIRAREALEGIPAETRQAFPDGTNGFERILPGPDRMYPDTDTPPLPVSDDLLARIQEDLPETPWAREERYREMGLDARTARALAAAPWADLFDNLEPEAGEVARRLATVMEKRIPFHLRERGIARRRWEEDTRELPAPKRLAPLVRAVEEEEVRPEAMAPALDGILASPEREVEAILSSFRKGPDDEARLEERLERVARDPDRPSHKGPGAVLEWAMGEVMPHLLGRMDPARVRGGLVQALELETVRETETETEEVEA